MSSLTITDLALRRGGFQLGPLDLAVHSGSRTAIVGPSGSGKTSLLRCIAGFERPDRGSIRIGDQLVADQRTALPPNRRGVGFVFQDGALWPHLSAVQHLRFAAPGLSVAAARELLARGGLGAFADRKPQTLSGGEAQRLGLLRALAADPKLLLLDEPLRSVDVHRRDDLVLLLRTEVAARRLTMVLVTHDRDEALALADDLVVMHQGRIVERGPALRLLQHPSTAFTAAFLAGAACLPTTNAADGSLATAFGDFPRPASASGELSLCLLPGDVVATTAPAPATGEVLACVPTAAGLQAKIAFQGQLLVAATKTPLAAGTTVGLQLAQPPRLLPWSH